jgi:rare lipoprotein A
MVASVVLIAALALVAVPGPAGSQPPSGTTAVGPEQLRPVPLDVARTGTVSYLPDPALRSASALETESVFREPTATSAAPTRPSVDQPAATPGSIDLNPWRLDGNVSWYGPGFYGNRTACGVAYTQAVVGVAHRSLPCGTRIAFRNPANGRVVVARVIDRGPYVAGRHWDLSAGLCRALGHCYTGSLYWKYG